MAPDPESDETRERTDEHVEPTDDVPPAETAEAATGGTSGDVPDDGPDDGAPEDAAEADAADAPDDEVASLREQLAAAEARAAEAEQKASEAIERARRSLADFENYRRRTSSQVSDARQSAKADVLRELVAVLDNFDRALEHAGDEEALYDGLKLIYRHLRSTLEAQGLRRVDAEGHAFDPQLHEAVMREPTAAYKEGVIIKEFEKGWFLGEKLLRPAKVKVAVAPPPGAEDTGEVTEEE